jgi:Chaperone of endosialidase
MKTSIRPLPIIALAIIGFAFLPEMQAVVPPPDGGYPGGNTAEGQNALLSLTTGQNNTAVGLNSLSSITTSSNNTAVGSAALRFNTDGHDNTASGVGALRNNTTGIVNVANGVSALQSNITGSSNTAIGVGALFSNTFGNSNTGVGRSALYFNIRGDGNTALGFETLLENTTGVVNTATGWSALVFNTTGSSNTAIGVGALSNNTRGNFNTALGSRAGYGQTTGSGNVYIGSEAIGVAGENNACYIASIFGQTSPSGVPVVINSDKKLGTVTSSKRFKENIKAMDKTSEALFSLQPVTFCYKKDIDLQGIPQFGLVAEDVEKVNPDLVIRDKEGKPYTVRYDAVNAMLLNEFLKEHRKVEEQQATITELRKELQANAARQQKQIEALAAGLQKVSAQLEMAKPAGEVATNDR